MSQVLKKLIKGLFIIIVTGFVVLLVTNLYIIVSTNDQITTIETIEADDYDCIMILGAGVRNGHPSPILRDRLLRGYQLYIAGTAPKILLTGDHHRQNYDELAAMQTYMRDEGVPDSDIFLDHAGLSTYDSMMRASRVFGVKKMIIVTQEFHINRALYLAEQAGIEAVAVSAPRTAYPGAMYRNMREVLARGKDFFSGLIKPQSYIGGPPIDIHGDGSVTDD